MLAAKSADWARLQSEARRTRAVFKSRLADNIGRSLRYQSSLFLEILFAVRVRIDPGSV